MSGADASKFNINPNRSVHESTLAFKANPDYESPGDSGGDNVYEVTLVVTDSKGNSDERDVTVKVTNIEEDWNGHPLHPAAAGWFPGDGHPG